ncbi:hypothetical protein [Caenispirillum bisanense]|uniref:Uncharacterized protein n=1 Tax=Caenispirillum bisanense TaxID=414052 RepID=A0A286GN17_9PROT|nr:hypothetical protein [Caenispirillum bisanense]SOD96927.1 hypothetical protein SAMN05421508_106164 [Caenispirillum bisanense]
MLVVPLAGAEKRLLHPAVPIGFFGTAVTAHVAAWLLAAVFPAEVLAAGGPGPGLAAVHALTLGVLVTTAVGALLQILPVTTQQDAPRTPLAALVLALTAGGGVVLVAGFALYSVPLLIAGAGSAVLGLTGFAALLVRLLVKGRAAGLVDTLPAVALAAVWLAALAVLALLLAHDYRVPLLPDHAAAAVVHLVVAAYGFMGFLVIGFSHVLVPMLAVAEPPKPGAGRPALVLATVSLLAAAGGLLGGFDPLVWVGLAGGLVASGLHVALMVKTVGKRLRRKLGPSFVLVRLSWVLLPASLVAGGLAYAGLVPPALFAVLLLPGWLLTLLLGILQRILPFLASMHTVRTCAKPLSAKTLEWSLPIRVVTLCHPAALGLLTVAAAFDLPLLARLGGAVGAVGACAFVLYAATVGLRARRHRTSVGPKQPRPVRPAAPPPPPFAAPPMEFRT